MAVLVVAVAAVLTLVVVVVVVAFCYSLEKSMISRRTQRGRRKDMYVVRDSLE